VKIPPTLQPLIDATQRQPPSLLQQLKIGQTLSAKVLDQLQPGLVRLQLASSVLLAKTGVALTPGSRLTLEVTKPFPLPELKILRALSRQEVREAVARAALPRQQTPAETRGTARALADGPMTPKTAESLRQLTAIQRDTGIRIEQLSPARVQRAVHNSGVLHEARLASQPLAMPATDSKLRLLQLFDELQHLLGSEPTKPRGAQTTGDTPAALQRDPAGQSLILRLLRLVEGALSRIQLQQAASLPQDDPQRQAWQLDLPLHLHEETQDAMLRIAREPSADPATGDPTWSFNLSFRFDTIGTLQCRVSLAGERLSATFWCEQATTQALIERRLPGLREAFEAQGFEVVHLAGIVGDPDDPLISIPLPDGLLDERA
jgi:hypothetical protein